MEFNPTPTLFGSSFSSTGFLSKDIVNSLKLAVLKKRGYVADYSESFYSV